MTIYHISWSDSLNF